MKIENVTPLPAPSLSAASTQFDAAPLRIVIAGSVDDGKSTLTGRFLYDAGLLLDDQLAALEAHSTLIDGGPDFAALTDGLTDEREQGITIDVAYRYFALHGRRVILADVPGHEQYTRNMVTAASDADAMVLLVDAERGPTPQTWRHLTLALLLGVSHIVVAVNKMDRIGFDSDRFADLSGGIQRRAAAFDPAYLHIMPVSALAGDNVVSASQSMPWYSGETLFDLLAGLPAAGEAATPLPADEMRLPVRYVSRPAQAARRAYLGRLAGGPLAVGDTIAVSPGGRRAVVEHLYALGEPVASADAGQSVSVVPGSGYRARRRIYPCRRHRTRFPQRRRRARDRAVLVRYRAPGSRPGVRVENADQVRPDPDRNRQRLPRCHRPETGVARQTAGGKRYRARRSRPGRSGRRDLLSPQPFRRQFHPD